MHLCAFNLGALRCLISSIRLSSQFKVISQGKKIFGEGSSIILPLIIDKFSKYLKMASIPFLRTSFISRSPARPSEAEISFSDIYSLVRIYHFPMYLFVFSRSMPNQRILWLFCKIFVFTNQHATITSR